MNHRTLFTQATASQASSTAPKRAVAMGLKTLTLAMGLATSSLLWADVSTGADTKDEAQQKAEAVNEATNTPTSIADDTKVNGAIKSTAKTQSCYLDGLAEQLECGKISVPENPNKPDGKHIDVHFAILPAIKNSYPNEALLAIAGGPGQSAIENAAGFDRMLTKVRQTRDILLIDQRGTGQSNQLQCQDDAMFTLSFNDDELNLGESTQACIDEIAKNNPSDISQYNSVTALKDFEAVREYLGYQQLHLYGISYGSRMAQLYMRHYPQALKTVTLDGIVPMQQSVIAIGGAIERGLNLLFSDCRNNQACQQTFPDLEQDFRDVDNKLANAPITQQVRDPLTNSPETLLMTRGKFNGAIRMAMYSPTTRALLPHAIHQAKQDDFQPILGLYALTADSTGIAMGMHASVVCSEDIHRVTEQMRKDAKVSYMSGSMLDGLEKTCDVWQMPLMDDSFSAPINSDIPTLLLSGEIDPATPPNWGAMATEQLSNAQHFIAPYATHGVAYQSCGNDLIAELVDTADVMSIDGSCLNKDVRRSFYLNANGVELVTDSDTSTSTTATADKE
ncbi:alpha/beta hydrolase [Shewanella sp. WXL01]|uniref:alpha/beta fold hydrolase n=1 Tax=Shewanella sp. WXL01 TaxID=2709721 RepID=UPI001FD94BDA|nr:alpha/beta hydrolase [Shewanella sp. WXL01]